jgi:hypothetical protein
MDSREVRHRALPCNCAVEESAVQRTRKLLHAEPERAKTSL